MSSAFSFKAQPVTRSYIVTHDENNNERGAYYFTESEVEAWIAGNAEITAIGSLLNIPSADFRTVLNSLGNQNNRFQERKTLLDMGKEIVIGDEVNSRIVVLRKVMGQQLLANGALGGLVAYICVENNAIDSTNLPNTGRFTPRVARI